MALRTRKSTRASIGVPGRLYYFQATHSRDYKTETNVLQRKAGKQNLSEIGQGYTVSRMASSNSRHLNCTLYMGWGYRGGHEGPASYHLELLLLSPLGWQIIQAVAAFMYRLLSFTQPGLYRLSTYFEVLHLDL